jgi:hypothetical protein
MGRTGKPKKANAYHSPGARKGCGSCQDNRKSIEEMVIKKSAEYLISTAYGVSLSTFTIYSIISGSDCFKQLIKFAILYVNGNFIS